MDNLACFRRSLRLGCCLICDVMTDDPIREVDLKDSKGPSTSICRELPASPGWSVKWVLLHYVCEISIISDHSLAIANDKG